MKRVDLIASLDIGKTVKKLREEKHLSQEELAKDICDRTNITKLENGYSKVPSLTFVMLICERLEVTIEEFLNYAMNNNYSLNHKRIIDRLLSNDYVNLNQYLSSLDPNLLSKNDQRYYKYLLLLINNGKEKQDYLSLLNNRDQIIDYIDLLIYSTLLKNTMLTNKQIRKFNNYLKENYKNLSIKQKPIEFLYFLHLMIEFYSITDTNIAKLYLQKEIEFINTHSCYNYLSYYYKDKINLYKSNIQLSKQSLPFHSLSYNSSPSIPI